MYTAIFPHFLQNMGFSFTMFCEVKCVGKEFGAQ